MTIVLATDGRQPVLLIGPDKSGPGRIVPLPLTGTGLRIAEGAAGTLWIGGVKNERMGFASARMSEAYLARLDRNGRVDWEKTFGKNDHKSIQDLASLSSGDAIVVGMHNRTSWVARISPAGKIFWEHYIGIPKGSSVTVVNDRIFVAAFEGLFGFNAYQENVVLWIFDQFGELLDKLVLRDGITTERPGYFGELRTERSNENIHVFSEWTDPFSPKPVQVAKLDVEGRLIWRTELPDEIQPNPGHQSFSYCSMETTSLANGDSLIACAGAEEGVLVRVDSATGAATRKRIVFPDCHQGTAARLLLKQESPNNVYVFGTRPSNVLAESCTWLGETSLDRFE